MPFWCLQFLPKNERKQVDLRFHSSKVVIVCLFFVGNVGLKKSFRLCLIFSDREKLLKFEAEGREFAKFLRSLEQFIQAVKGQNNLW
jgi:hypothetical protein